MRALVLNTLIFGLGLFTLTCLFDKYVWGFDLDRSLIIRNIIISLGSMIFWTIFTYLYKKKK